MNIFKACPTVLFWFECAKLPSVYFTRRLFIFRPATLVLGMALWLYADCSQADPLSLLPVKVGAYYYDGWNNLNDSAHFTPRLTNEFKERKPVWGWLDNTSEIMQRQIDCAADGGLRFFAFDWYWPENKNKETPRNNALGLYLTAPNRQRLDFCLLVANHVGYRIGPKDWSAVCQMWLELFRQPTYLKVQGKPLLIFFSPKELLAAFGSASNVDLAFQDLRRQALDKGFSGVTIAACATPGPENGWNDLEQLTEAGFDIFTGYNYHGVGRTGNELKQPFNELIDGSEHIWNLFAAKTPLPYVPVVTAGWDKRPLEKIGLPESKQEVYYSRTPALVRNFMKEAVSWLNRHSDHTPSERLILIYAWNELGEGGYIMPTEQDGGSILKAITMALPKYRDSRPPFSLPLVNESKITAK